MKTTVNLIHRNDMRCETSLPGGAGILHVDSLKHKTRADCGPSPLDLLALAHGGCTAMLAAMKGAAEGLDVTNMGVEVTHEYDDGPPMRLRGALIRFVLPGALTVEQEARLRAAAGMCPVHTALRPDVKVTIEFITKH
jgi:uncharacterized OsmC-like protein